MVELVTVGAEVAVPQAVMHGALVALDDDAAVLEYAVVFEHLFGVDRANHMHDRRAALEHRRPQRRQLAMGRGDAPGRRQRIQQQMDQGTMGSEALEFGQRRHCGSVTVLQAGTANLQKARIVHVGGNRVLMLMQGGR